MTGNHINSFAIILCFSGTGPRQPSSHSKTWASSAYPLDRHDSNVSLRAPSPQLCSGLLPSEPSLYFRHLLLYWRQFFRTVLSLLATAKYSKMTIFFNGPNFTNNDMCSAAASGIRSSFTSLSDKHLFRFSLLQKYQGSIAFSVLLNLPLCLNGACCLSHWLSDLAREKRDTSQWGTKIELY